jgi:SAM-dependent methyltransferase
MCNVHVSLLQYRVFRGGHVNEGHAEFCSSPEWAAFIVDEVLPTVVPGRDLADVLEVGPGYGAATAYLAAHAERLTAVEIDLALAARLRQRFPSVRVIEGRGESLPLPDTRFTAVFAFTMLHHMHSAAAQDAFFGEAHRTLRADGVFAGSDSIASPDLREFHRGDVYNPVDPDALPDRLRACGFTGITVQVAEGDDWFAFAARAA